jgi:tetratricopeptide (TPR) repeat protein
MWIDLPKLEQRFLLQGVGGALATVVVCVAFWTSSLSPAALDRTAARAARGDVQGAVSAYLDQSDALVSVQRRGEAMWRASVLTHVSLTDPQGAVVLLERLIENFPDHARVVDAHARIAMIQRHHDGDPIRAGVRWVAAASIDPAHPEAGRWMLDAGLAFADAGDLDNALSALRIAATRTEQAVAAHLAQGRIHLQRDPAQAYADYDAAFRAGAGVEAGRLAHLGMATALEYLDRRDAALAELDEALEDGDIDAALQRRRNRLRARRSP